jgi:hypothetical protein
MSRLRWILAGVLALIAAVAAVQALLTYIEHHIIVGVLAVLALLVTLVAGLASLAQARRRIEVELQGLRARPARGELATARLRRLEAIKAAGARPDPEALADTSAAEEAGRAYIGRYLVATTVLIGLVGTFAGLMETLGKVSPLLSESGNGGLALLAAPLAGLHVTFGASLVAILATLALALVQGDLALHEELALAALGDLTTHELIPQLWPGRDRDDGADRTVQAIGELQKSFGELKQTFGDALVRSLEKGAGKLAAETRAESERAARALEAAAGAVEKQITRLADGIANNLAEGSRRHSAALVDGAAKQTEGLIRHAAAFADSLGRSAAIQAEAASKSGAAHAQALEALRAQLTASLDQAVGQHGETLISTTNAVAARLEAAATTTLGNLRGEWEAALARSSSAAEAALRTSLEANQALLRQAIEATSAASLEASAAAKAASVEATAAAKAASLEATAAAQTASLKLTEAAELATVRGAEAAEAVLSRGIAAAQEATTRAAEAAEAAAARGASAGEEAAARAAAATEEAVRRSITVCEETVRALSDRLGSSVEPLFATEADRLEAVRASLVEISARLDAASGRLTEVTGAVAELGRGHTSALEETGKAVLAAFDRAVLGGGAALDGAAKVLAEAARDLRAGTEGFAPTLGQLSTDLASLGREVALMAARNPESDSSVVVLAELERLGTGVDRLTSLYELAQGTGAAADEGANGDGVGAAATASEESDGAGESAGDGVANAAAGEVASAVSEGATDSDAADASIAPGDELVDADIEAALAAKAEIEAVTAPEATGDGAPDATAGNASDADELAAKAPATKGRGGRGKRKGRARDRATETDATEPTPPTSDALAAAAESSTDEAPASLPPSASEALDVAAEPGAEPDLTAAAEVTTDEIGEPPQASVDDTAIAASEPPTPAAPLASDDSVTHEIEIAEIPAIGDEETGEVAGLVGVHESSDDVPAVTPDAKPEGGDDETDPDADTFLAAPASSDEVARDEESEGEERRDPATDLPDPIEAAGDDEEPRS